PAMDAPGRDRNRNRYRRLFRRLEYSVERALWYQSSRSRFIRPGPRVPFGGDAARELSAGASCCQNRSDGGTEIRVIRNMRRKNQQYIHGSSPKEQRRLASLNELLNQACLSELALKGNESVLDIGSGLGQFTRAIARSVRPNGRVVGIERDAKQLAEARRSAGAAPDRDRVEWRRGDATGLALNRGERGPLELAQARWGLEPITRQARTRRPMPPT